MSDKKSSKQLLGINWPESTDFRVVMINSKRQPKGKTWSRGTINSLLPFAVCRKGDSKSL